MPSLVRCQPPRPRLPRRRPPPDQAPHPAAVASRMGRIQGRPPVPGAQEPQAHHHVRRPARGARHIHEEGEDPRPPRLGPRAAPPRRGQGRDRGRFGVGPDHRVARLRPHGTADPLPAEPPRVGLPSLALPPLCAAVTTGHVSAAPAGVVGIKYDQHLRYTVRQARWAAGLAVDDWVSKIKSSRCPAPTGPSDDEAG